MNEETQLAERSNHALSWASALVVTTDDEDAEASDTLRGLKTLRKRVADVFDPPIKAAHESHKAAIAAKKKVDGPLDEAEKLAKRKIGVYRLERDKRIREEQRKAEEAARRAAEDQRLREAEALERAGRKDAADMVLSQPPAPVTVAPVVTAPKVEGTKTTKHWKHEVIAPDLVPRDCCAPSDSLIRQRLIATDGRPIPGVRAWLEGSISVEAK